MWLQPQKVWDKELSTSCREHSPLQFQPENVFFPHRLIQNKTTSFPYFWAKIKLEFAAVFLTHICALHSLGVHSTVKHRGDFQQFLHCIAICLVKLLRVQLYVSLGSLWEERIYNVTKNKIFTFSHFALKLFLGCTIFFMRINLPVWKQNRLTVLLMFLKEVFLKYVHFLHVRTFADNYQNKKKKLKLSINSSLCEDQQKPCAPLKFKLSLSGM